MGCFLALAFAAPFFSSGTVAQGYPSVIMVPVTFYDFHSDRSNPEFEQQHKGGLRTNMVAASLGADGKPIIGSQPYCNYYLKYWFQPWELGAKGDKTISHYDPRAPFMTGFYGGENWKKEFEQEVTYKGVIAVDHDTSFKNIVIYDTLPFTHSGNGLYEYRNDAFFPLDNRGFGNEWNHEKGKPDDNSSAFDHNYSFTMELHWNFTKKQGMNFSFRGDDDVWVFVNKKLQLDLGGIHLPQDGTFQVDNIAGLQNGQNYALDVFYAERHSAESHIQISTNILFAPSNLRLYGAAGTPDEGNNQPLGTTFAVKAGVPTPVYGHVFDSVAVWHPEFDGKITWEIEGVLGSTTIANKVGASTSITATQAALDIFLVVRFTNPENPAMESVQRLQVSVIADVGDHLDIQRDSAVVSYGANDNFDFLAFTAKETAAKIWVVVCDRFGNFVRYTDAAQWQSGNPAYFTLTSLQGRFTGVTKLVAGDGEETFIVVSEPGLKPDTIGVGSAKRQIVAVMPNPFIPGKPINPADLGIPSVYLPVITNASEKSGTVLFFETPLPLVPLVQGSVVTPSTSYAKILVHDGVGNVVRRDLTLLPAQTSRRYGVVWDGSNQRGRYVGAGTYLFCVSGTMLNADGKRLGYNELVRVGVVGVKR